MTVSQDPPPHLPVRPGWLVQHREEILEPGLEIVDPHHHLWDRPGNRYFLPELLADLDSGHDVRQTVFIECRAMYRADAPEPLQPVGETEFVNGIAAMSASGAYGRARVCAGIVGYADLRLGAAVGEVLDAQVAAGGGRFRGIRNSSPWHETVVGSSVRAPRGLLADPGFRAGFACLAPRNLTFDAWMYHTQLDELVDLARAFPDTVIVLDHIGGALGIGPYRGRRELVFADWRRAMQTLAGCPNVNVKLGGLGMPLTGFDFYARPLPPGSTELAEAWRPWVETCITLFGAGRCMFESNFPVDKGMFSYAVMWNAFKRLALGASAAEKAALFNGTARRVYRLA